MSRLLITMVMLLVGAAAAVHSAHSADLKRGMAAYKKGDYTAALTEWIPLAE